MLWPSFTTLAVRPASPQVPGSPANSSTDFVMRTNDPIQAECLSLVASLYGAVTDADRFQSCRAECDSWLARQVTAETPATAFLRLQIGRATEARNLASASRSSLPTEWAVLTVDDQGRVLAASPETWRLLGGGADVDGALRLPLSLRAFAEDASLSPSVPRALRVVLDDGSRELAGIVLGVDRIRHTVGTLGVLTLLLCDVGPARAPIDVSPPSRAEVREFKRVVRDREPTRPFAVSLAADRSA